MPNAARKLDESEIGFQASSPATKKFGMQDKLGYMFGDFGNDFFFVFTSMFLMVFYTDVMGISAAIAGLLFMVARFWDAFMDVVVGRFIDSRTATKNGKFKPWMLKAAPLMVIFGILTFTKIPGMSNNFYMIYAFATYILWGSLYSAVNIPYGSMASVITDKPVERSSLSTFRTVGSKLSGLLVGIIAPMVVFVNNKADGSRFTMIAVAFAILSMICYVLCYKMSTERITAQAKTTDSQVKLSIGKTLKSLLKNKPFLALVAASLISIFNLLLIGTMNAYLFKDYFHNAKALSFSSMVGLLLIVLVGPAVSPLVKKFGMKETVSVGLLASSILYFVMFLLPIHNAYLFVILNFIASLGAGFFSFTAWAFVTDVIDYQEYLTGTREDATVYSIYSFVKKIGQALSGGLGGVALAAIGYVANAPEQAAGVATNIRNFALLTPAIGYLIEFAILAFLYPLTREKLAQLSKDLTAKRLSK